MFLLYFNVIDDKNKIYMYLGRKYIYSKLNFIYMLEIFLQFIINFCKQFCDLLFVCNKIKIYFNRFLYQRFVELSFYYYK